MSWAFANIHECPNCHEVNFSILEMSYGVQVECQSCGFDLVLTEWNEEAVRAAPMIWAKRQAEHYRIEAERYLSLAIVCEQRFREIENKIKQEKQS